MDFTLSVGDRGSASIVKVSGEVDVSTAPRLDACLQNLISNGRAEIILDLENCSYFDSEGLNTLIQAYRSADRQGIMAISGASAAVTRILELSGLQNLFPIRQSASDF